MGSVKVIEHLERADRPLISFEIIPPKRGGSLKKLLSLVEDLAEYKPPFIDITSHAAQESWVDTAQGQVRRVRRKRPGTLGICALIQNKFGIDAVPHVLCQGFSQEETEDFLIELHYLGIDNVLALRGDTAHRDDPSVRGQALERHYNHYADDLVSQIAALNRGDFLDGSPECDPMQFCIGVAGYPEKHFEAQNLDEDIARTKAKVEAGAEYLVTQMFFNNDHYFGYVDKCRAAGINVPIIPGLKVLTSKKQLTAIPRIFYCEIPSELSSEIECAESGKEVEVGAEWAAQQTRELLERGAPSVHFYVMQSAAPVRLVFERLKLDF